MKFLHTMIRVYDLQKNLDFFQKGLGLIETRRKDYEKGRFTLVYLATEIGEAEVEFTHNWDQTQPYKEGDHFGHLAFEVDNIYEVCERFQKMGVTISRPPKDGHMAFIRSPDQISIELLQKGPSLELKEPWISMPNIGKW